MKTGHIYFGSITASIWLLSFGIASNGQDNYSNPAWGIMAPIRWVLLAVCVLWAWGKVAEAWEETKLEPVTPQRPQPNPEPVYSPISRPIVQTNPTAEEQTRERERLERIRLAKIEVNRLEAEQLEATRLAENERTKNQSAKEAAEAALSEFL